MCVCVCVCVCVREKKLKGDYGSLCFMLVIHFAQVPPRVTFVQLGTSALELSYQTHVLQGSTVLKELVMILNPVQLERLVIELC